MLCDLAMANLRFAQILLLVRMTTASVISSLGIKFYVGTTKDKLTLISEC